jgi:hypothetical protein
MIELRHFAKVGRSLIASQEFRPGDVVVSDSVALRWDAAAVLPDDLAAIAAKYTTLQPVLAAAVHAFTSRYASDSTVVRAVLDMHVPDLPISLATAELLRFCAEAASLRGTGPAMLQGAPERTIGAKNACGDMAVLLMHVAMAAKVNSHRAANGDWCLFPTASKLAHSCDPNLFFVPPDAEGNCSFVATRLIAPGELLSFSYLGGPALQLSTPLRQLRLRNSHLFVCQCSRCDGRDYNRQLWCPKRCGAQAVSHLSGGTLPLIARLRSVNSWTDGDAFPAKPWECRNCGSTFTDEELQPILLEEERLIKAVDSVRSDAYKLAELRDLTSECAEVLGAGHHAYLAMANHLTQYFRIVTMSTAGEALPAYMVWAARYLDALALQGVETAGGAQDAKPQYPHMLTAAAIRSMAVVWSAKKLAVDAPRFQAVVVALAARALPLFEAIHGAGDDRLQPFRAVVDCSAVNAEIEVTVPPPARLTDVSRCIYRLWPAEWRLHVGCAGSTGSAAPPPKKGRESPLHVEDPSLEAALGLWERILAAARMSQALLGK